MAPIRPSKASITTTKSNQSSKASALRPRSLDDPYTVPHPQNKAFTKIQKRHVKHATLLSRLQRTTTDSKIKKRRRPSQRLVSDLAALADALPEDLKTTIGALSGPDGYGKVKHKSLKSRPGAVKRREKLLLAERARFDKNLALMASGPAKAGDSEVPLQPNGTNENRKIQPDGLSEAAKGTKAKWTAIREHISRTMETIDRIPTSK